MRPSGVLAIIPSAGKTGTLVEKALRIRFNNQGYACPQRGHVQAITALALVLTGPNPVQPAIVGRQTRAIEVTSMTGPTSSERCGPYRGEVCVVARWIFLGGVSYIILRVRVFLSSRMPESGCVSGHLRTPFLGDTRGRSPVSSYAPRTSSPAISESRVWPRVGHELR